MVFKNYFFKLMLSGQQGMLLEGLLVKFIVSSEDETQLTGEKLKKETELLACILSFVLL